MTEYIITPIDDKEAPHPNMLKCINCGEPAVFYVNGKRVCFDKVCFNKYTGAFNELSLRKEIDDAITRILDLKHEYWLLRYSCTYNGTCLECEEVRKELTLAKERLNELLEERTKRYREYLGEE